MLFLVIDVIGVLYDLSGGGEDLAIAKYPKCVSRIYI